MAHVDRISQLPDALLLKILSLLPAKEVVNTMVLSKRWQFLWALVPRLVYEYYDSYENIEYETISRFIYRSLLLHEAPGLETLAFKLSEKFVPVDIGVWTSIAVKLCVRELYIEIDCSSSQIPVILPRKLFSSSKILVDLRLNNVTLVNFSSSVSFPSLKVLGLVSVKYPNNEYVNRFLFNCPVLLHLIMERRIGDAGTIFIRVPSLSCLVLSESPDDVGDDSRGFVIDTPSLQGLYIDNFKSEFCVFESNMPDIIRVDVDVSHSHLGKILSAITSVQDLYLCLPTSKDLYPVGTTFHRLEYLKVCTCDTEWLNLLMCMLSASPNLQYLELKQTHDHRNGEPRPWWSEPSSVPECVVSSLETLLWVRYEGTKEEKEVVAFMLRNGNRLKKVLIYSKSKDPLKKLEMIKELSLSPRLSSTCQLIFN